MVPATILIITSSLIFVLAVVATSYRTGFIAYSIWSVTRKNQPKFEVDRAKIDRYVGVSIGVYLSNVIFGFMVVQDAHETGPILIWAFINAIVISWALSFWLLLKEKG